MADRRETILIVDDEPAAIELLYEDLGGRRLAVARALNQVRNMIRLAHGPGDLSAETAGRLDEHMARARCSVGLS